jgi:hypothetical protein
MAARVAAEVENLRVAGGFMGGIAAQVSRLARETPIGCAPLLISGAVLSVEAGLVTLPDRDESRMLSVSPPPARPPLSPLPSRGSAASNLGSQEGCSSPTDTAPGAPGRCGCISPVAASESCF